jgi:hypothetical protein
MSTKDRAIPFSISLSLSKLERLERVLKLAAHQGRLTGDTARPNKLAAEALMILCAQWEADFRAQGLLPHEEPIATGALPASMPVDSARLATDPAARARARAAQGFDHAANGATDQTGVQTLAAPPGINWDEVP